MSVRSIVIHGHFYQPPREDPWLNQVAAEPSAAPYHDWNERIERESYRAVVAARVYAPDGRIAQIVNTLASISFNFGATLLDWLEREAPATYAAVLEADRASRARHAGHGNAIAMPYHHVIMPLASRRDKVTEVRWGIADFRRRFGRDPEGMWLPETAVGRAGAGGRIGGTLPDLGWSLDRAVRVRRRDLARCRVRTAAQGCRSVGGAVARPGQAGERAPARGGGDGW
ncbi:MAG: hypothetical protein AUI88_00300 [Gemmatimonadetes bacterium 13_1_40CM_3_70_8]|nr:MAG: hypothetical protein AUI88_00300 [Gemmatimonadetes bacterium 13_1_40CM_3_70_8]